MTKIKNKQFRTLEFRILNLFRISDFGFRNSSLQNGQSILEVIVAMAIFSLISAAMIAMVTGSFVGLEQGGEQTQAEALVQEGIEAVRAIRDRAWNENIYSTSSVAVSGSQWAFSGEGTTEIIGQFTRTISFNDVCRDSADEIVVCPGNYTDVHTKEILSKITWDTRQGVSNTVRRVAYITNWDSREWTQTDWSGGSGQSIWSDTTKYDTDDGNANVSVTGEVKLASSGGAGSQEWIFGGGSNFIDTTDTHFNAGTLNDTQVVDSGTPAKVTLDTESKWDLFDFAFGSADMNYASENWAVGDNGKMFEWTGSQWVEVTALTSEDLFYVSEVSDNEAYAVGDNGAVLRYKGNNWSLLSSPTTERLNSVSMISSSDGFAVGYNGAIIRWNGSSWSTVSSPTSKNLESVYMISSSDGFAVGWQGTIIQWNGSAWSTVSSPTVQTLYSVYMISSSDGFAVGNNGAIIQWNGSSWSTIGSPTVRRMNGVSMISSSDGFAAGDKGTIIRWDGSSWSNISSPSDQFLRSVYMISSSDGWIAGENGMVLRWNGSIWQTYTQASSNNFNNVSMISSTDGFTVGQQGVVIQWDGGTWTEITSPTNKNLYGVSMVSSSDGFAVGRQGVIIQWNGSSWSTVTSPTSSDLNDVYMVSSSDGWAVGAGGVIIQWNGSSWSTVTSPTSNNLTSVSMASSSLGYALGASGIIIKWDGASWSIETSPTSNNLFGLDLVSSSDGWGVGVSGALIHLSEFFTTSGTFLSRVFDGGTSTTTWDIIQWTENNYSPTDLTVATRTGNTSTPDGTWSGWSAELTEPTSSSITSSDARYFQYRGTFSTTDIVVSSELEDITIIYNDPNITDNVNAVSMVSTSDGWAVADAGTIVQWDNSDWSSVSSATTTNFNDVFMISSSDGWAVGNNGAIMQWNGTSWSAAISPTSGNLNGIHMVSSSDGWAVGAGGVIIQWNGSSWSTVTSPTAFDLSGVDFVSSSDGWAVGASGKILRYTGSSWSEFTDSGAETLRGINMVSTSDGWIVGDSGKILDWDNVAWLLFNSPTTENLNGVDMATASDGWIVGDNGTFLHLLVETTLAANSILISSAFDMGDASPVQIIEWDQTIPSCSPACEIKFEVSSAPDASGSPGTWTDWYGVSGTGTYFATSTGSLVPTALNDNQWVRYRLTLAGDGNDTPVLQEIRINYK